MGDSSSVLLFDARAALLAPAALLARRAEAIVKIPLCLPRAGARAGGDAAAAPLPRSGTFVDIGWVLAYFKA